MGGMWHETAISTPPGACARGPEGWQPPPLSKAPAQVLLRRLHHEVLVLVVPLIHRCSRAKKRPAGAEMGTAMGTIEGPGGQKSSGPRGGPEKSPNDIRKCETLRSYCAPCRIRNEHLAIGGTTRG